MTRPSLGRPCAGKMSMDYASHQNKEGYSSTAKEFIQAQSEAAIARTLGTVKPPKTHAKTVRPATSSYLGSDYEPPKMLAGPPEGAPKQQSPSQNRDDGYSR